MVEYEDILIEVGQLGWYQLTLVLLIDVGWKFNTGWDMMLMIYVGANPGYTCPNTNLLNVSGLTNQTWPTSSLMQSTPSYLGSNATNRTGLVKDQCGPTNEICDGYVFNKDFTSIVSEWQLVCGTDFVSDTITSLQMAGVLFGSLIFGQLSDWFGRKKTFYTAIMMVSLFGFIQSFSVNWYMFAALRFFNGVAIGGGIVIGFVWSVEFLGPKYRPILGVFGAWPFGGCILTAIAYFTRDWRQTMMGTSLPGFLWLFAWWYLPESPRWLLTQGRYDEVKAITQRIAERNKKPMPDIDTFFKDYETQRRLQEGEKHVSTTYWDLFRTPAMAKMTLSFMFVWFSVSVISYGLQFNLKNMAGDIYINTLINVGTLWVFNVVLSVLPMYFGRKKCIISYQFIAVIILIPVVVLYVLEINEEYWLITNILSTTANNLVSTSWTNLFVWTGESYPTRVRDIGIGLNSMAARVGGILAPQTAYLTKFWNIFPFVLSGALSLASGLLNLTQDETRDKLMQDDLPERTWCFCGKKDDDDDLSSDRWSVKNGTNSDVRRAHVNEGFQDTKI
ncbi:organic cation transporter protein [Lingula anatina]|uniref:Organic cation transporter protein n=1 Tax=Lingula anatina TaxID=7574 RepID=A0A1S3IDJ8_LINAN|nr:organic cation transporter protein [Lingula anatina]|eukprot:XP_013396312.1 organic cation transporter protein [Lingula anatina]